ncbi:uncharacterized protein CBL_03254 [Carabus blaptoides fortunei]
MAETVVDQATNASTVIVQSEDSQEVHAVKLRLRKPKTDKKVQWSNETVDNENMNKKKSKCCCIYQKPRKFNESSSDEEEDECDHCKGHVEKRKTNRSEEPPSPEESVSPN